MTQTDLKAKFLYWLWNNRLNGVVMMSEKEIGFKNLKTHLKIVVVFAYISMAFYVIAFLVGFIQGLIEL